MLRTRGYSTKRFQTLQSAYYNKPTPLQVASHHVHLVELLRDEKFYDMGMILSSGISPNPCNEWGESIVHMLCRRGDYKMLDVFVKSNCTLQVADDFGRTPLHDACWAAEPCFETAEIIIQADPRLLHMTDCRDSPPLSYVPRQHWSKWNHFLDSIKDTYFPVRDLEKDGEQGPPPLVLEKPQSRPVPDPKGALSIELAGMVAAGTMDPEEAKFLNEDDGSDDAPEWGDEDDDFDKTTSHSGDCDLDSSTASIATFCEDEMESILLNISTHAGKPIRW